MQAELTDASTHFAFGKNWAAYSQIIDADRIARSDADLAKLLPAAELRDKTVIDIGCGSGLPALSMLRSGAAHVTCVDIDPNSVNTAKQVLTKLAPRPDWTANVESVFDLTGAYDVVYSWGVLHHTGDMWRAIDKAAGLVKPGGTFVLAIYGKGKLCEFWKKEKRFYSRAPRVVQQLMLMAYTALHAVWYTAKGKSLRKEMGEFRERGMSWKYDAHDWLGGYPYESATPQEIEAFLTKRGFAQTWSNTIRPNLKSGCDEYRFRRI